MRRTVRARKPRKNRSVRRRKSGKQNGTSRIKSSRKTSQRDRPSGTDAYIVHAWEHRRRLRIAGRTADGGSFAAEFRNPVRHRFEPFGTAESARVQAAGADTPLWSDFSGRVLVPADSRGSIASGLGLVEEFLCFNGIRGSVRLEGSRLRGKRVDAVFIDPDIAPAEWKPRIEWAAIDIETDPQGRVRAVSLVGKNTDLVFFWGSDPAVSADPRIRVHPDEAGMLGAFASAVRALDPDVITGWNSTEFDFPMLAQRYRATGIPFDIGRAEDEQVQIRRSEAGRPVVFIPGRQTLDAMRIVRSSGRSFDDLRLDTVAKAVLGRGKLVSEAEDEAPRGSREKIRVLEELRAEDPTAYCLYCLEDARLVLDILAETGLDELSLERAVLTGVGLNLAWTSIPAFERIYAIELVERRILPPSAQGRPDVSSAAGGTVLEPIPGCFENVLVFDFRSLYPSVMRTFNIDPVAYERTPQDDTPYPYAADSGTAMLRPGYENTPESPFITAPNGARFHREPGILPELLSRYFRERERAIADGDAVGAFVYKILMNSFYGVLGSPGCVYARTALAGAITGFGRICLHFARDWFRARGASVLYGDTDSVFVYFAGKDAGVSGEMFADELTGALAAEIRRIYGIDSCIRMRFEKPYRRFLLPRLRTQSGSDPIVRGRAKGYAGMHAETGAIEIKGMEAARSDYTALARRFQTELLGLVFAGRGPSGVEAFVRAFAADLLSGKLDAELEYRKILRKPAHEYTHSAPPQVRAARKLGWTRERGRIRYRMTMAGPEPAGFETAPIDYRHYIDHQLRPIWRSVCDAADLGSGFADLPSGTAAGTTAEAARNPRYDFDPEAAADAPASGEAGSRYADLDPFADQLELGF